MDTSSQQTPQFDPKPNRGLAWILIVILVIAIAAGIWYFKFYNQPSKTAETNTTTTTSTTGDTSSTGSTAISSDLGLQSASADLDSSNPDSIDTSLRQNDTDSSQF